MNSRYVVATTPDGELGVAYLPDNAEIALRMDAFAGPVTAKWFDPQTQLDSASGRRVPEHR